jgi:Asp-tRNA(Asn)/Glu-tRNA(Gln) amidotransferase A subunit family amidase
VRRDVEPRSKHATAFLQVRFDEVRAAAKASSKRWSSGTPLGPLDGVPIAVKDEIDLDGYSKSLGSCWSVESKGTSWCVKKLIEAGAIVLGKSTMHELGLGEFGSKVALDMYRVEWSTDDMDFKIPQATIRSMVLRATRTMTAITVEALPVEAHMQSPRDWFH